MKPTIREVLDSALGDDHYDAVLAERVEAVLRLHKPIEEHPIPRYDGRCVMCLVPLPCPTVKALNGEQ